MKFLSPTSTALAAALLLTACGGSDNFSSGNTNLTGVAAVGAPIVGGSIKAQCKNGSTYPATGSVLTNNAGSYNMSVPASAYPCVVQSKGGTVGYGAALRTAPTLHSTVANSSNTRANITPLTDIITALTLKKGGNATALETWFDSAEGSAELDSLASGLSATQTDLITALAAQGFNTGSLPNPFNGGLVASTTGSPNNNPYDNLLDALQEALGATQYEDFLTALVNACDAASCDSDVLENVLPEAPDEPTDPTDPEEPTDPEAPSNISVLTAFAGTYTVTGTATEPSSRGTATRAHDRGTVIINANGNVDFDTGISFTAAQINNIYDRRNICDLPPQADRSACRIHVNYDNDDSGRKLELFLALDKTTVTEIRYQDGQGGLTRAAVGGEEPEEPSVLGNDNGVTLLADGVRHTTTYIESYTGSPLSVGTGYLSAGRQTDEFRANISGIIATQGYSASCQNNGIPGVTVYLHGHAYDGTPNQGGSCTVTTASIDTTRILVNFSGQLKRTTESETAPEYINVTSGEFQYTVHTFEAGNGAALVNASFEDAAAGNYYSSNPLTLGVADFGWKDGVLSGGTTVKDVSANPLQVTPAGGSLLSGGDRAITWFNENKLEKSFNGDLYVSLLMRWGTPGPGKGLIANNVLTLANQAVFVGIRNNKFMASIGDTVDKKFESAIDAEANTTYHVVGRLRKTEGSDNYNEITLWVNPARNGEANPLGSATNATFGTGAMRYVDKVGLNQSGNNVPDYPAVDRIRLSDTWEGLFDD